MISSVGTLGSGQYVYDANGRRVRKTVGGVNTEFIYDLSGNVVAEMQGTTWTKGYVYFGGQLVAQYDNTANPATTYFVHKDHLGPVCGLRWSPLRCFQSGKINRSPKAGPDSRNRSSTRLLTKLDKSPLETAYDYLPFGEPIGPNGSGTTKKFTGKERDSESGLDYFGARYYVSLTGRFLNADLPFIDQNAGNPQSWNLFAYARSNPLALIDPSGRFSQMVNGQPTRYSLDGIELFGDMLGLITARDSIEQQLERRNEITEIKGRITHISFWKGPVQVGEGLAVEILFEDISVGTAEVSLSLVKRISGEPVSGAEALVRNATFVREAVDVKLRPEGQEGAKVPDQPAGARGRLSIEAVIARAPEGKNREKYSGGAAALNIRVSDSQKHRWNGKINLWVKGESRRPGDAALNLANRLNFEVKPIP